MIKISRRGLDRLIESFLLNESLEKTMKSLTSKLNEYMGKIEDKDKSSGGDLEDIYRMMASVVGGVKKDFSKKGTKEGSPELIKKMKKLAEESGKKEKSAKGKIKRKYKDLLADISRLANNMHMQYAAGSPDAFKGDLADIKRKRGEIDQAEDEFASVGFDTDISMSGYTKDTAEGESIHATNFKAHVEKMIKAYQDSKGAKSTKLVELLNKCLEELNNAENLQGRKDEKAKNESLSLFFAATRDASSHLKTMQTNEKSKNMTSMFIRLANSSYNYLKKLPVKAKDSRPIQTKAGKKFVFDVGPLKMPGDQKGRINYAQELLYIGLQEGGEPPRDGKWSTAQPLWERFCDKFSIRSDAKKNWKAYAKETDQKQSLTGLVEFIHLTLKGGEPA